MGVHRNGKKIGTKQLKTKKNKKKNKKGKD